MKAFAKKPATYEDLKKVPPEMLAQIVDGELIAAPRPVFEHQQAASLLLGDLMGPFDRGRGGPGGWQIRSEVELHFGPNILVPDVAGWRRERVPELIRGAFTTIAPDWICEILSPSTTGLDRVRKMPIYLREHVSHLWLIDPVGQTVEVYKADQSRWVLLGNFEGNQKMRAEPFESLELELAAFWVTPGETP